MRLVEALDGLGADPVEIAFLGRPGGDQAAARQRRDREPAVVVRDEEPRLLAPPLEVRVFVQVGVIPEGAIDDGPRSGRPVALSVRRPRTSTPRFRAMSKVNGPGLGSAPGRRTRHSRKAGRGPR